jgi:hypothetical protein
MSTPTESRLDAMMAPLREHRAELDEIAQARVRARLEAAMAQADAAAGNALPRWRRGRVIALAAAAAAVGVVVAARDGSPRADDSAGAGQAVAITEPAAKADSPDPTAAARATGPLAEGAAGFVPDFTPRPRAAGTKQAADRAAIAPVTVAAGESANLNVGDAAVTVYGPGRLSLAPDGAIVDAASIMVDRAQGDEPWSVRFHGIKIVAMQATFAVAHQTEVRVTVMRGEIALFCPSGTQTIRAGASGSCEPAAKLRLARTRVMAAAAVRPAPPPAPEVPSGPAAVPADAYREADAAMRGDLDAARDALLAVIDAHPSSLDAATALLYLARMAAVRGDTPAAFDYLTRLDRHPFSAMFTASVANLRVTLARYANVQSLKP